MPVEKLIREAKKAGIKPGTDRFNAYVYSTERKIKQARAAKRKKRAHGKKK